MRRIIGQVLCGSRIGNLLSVRHEFMLIRWYGRVEMHPVNLKFNILWYKREGKKLHMTNTCSSRHTLLYTMKTKYFTGTLNLVYVVFSYHFIVMVMFPSL